ncbi:MAG: histidinol-phosphate transaminase [Desulfomonile tiedjei]|uniref:Histidinol-phosphate aminotransferase n=1 Tax=Desulfomonile tiedjei TaxID=2358 RepID=A0A9D6V0T7_9BACT|nr:histidinol-phosphate transaminase [Desulfomonile tiedjei]
MSPLCLDNLLPDYIKRFEAYIPSKPDPELVKLYGCRQLYRLNNNENPLGPPEAAREAIAEFPAPRAAVYPSGDAYYLRQKLAEKFNMEPDQFLVGNGANEVISFVIKAFCESGDNIITADKTFAVYEWVAEFSGFVASLVPLKNYEFDDQGMLDRIDDRTKILFICNPNNPTGTYWNTGRLRRFMDEINGSKIVVLDEAYFEFVEAEDYPNGLSLTREYPNLVIFRTFSKMYGLAGLRIGYLAGDLSVVDAIRRTCIVYSVNSLAQVAAVAALGADDHIVRTRSMVRQGKEFLKRELSRLGLTFVCHEGNFIMIKLPMSDTLAYRKLMTQGVMVRAMTSFRYPNHIRVTVSEMEAMQAFIDALEKILP